MKFKLKIFLTHSLLIVTISLLLLTPILSTKIPLNNSELSQLNISNAKSKESPVKSSVESVLSRDNISFLTKRNEEIFINGNQGVNSYSNLLGTSECYKVFSEVNGPMKFEGSFSSAKNKKELLNSLKIFGEGKIGNAKFGIGIGFNFEQTFSENSRSEYYYYYSKYYRTRTFKFDPLIENVITQDGKDTLNSSLKNKDQKFYKLCGDSLIKSVEEGGIVIIQVQIEFESSYKKNVFASSGNLNLGDLFGISSSINSSFEKLDLSGKVKFNARQIGGFNEKLMTIFPNDNTHQCSLTVDPKIKDNTASQKCTEFLKNVESYVHDSFPNQFTSRYDPSIYHTFKYDHVLIQGLDLPEFDKTNSILNQLKTKYENFKSVNGYYLYNMIKFKNNNNFFEKLDDKFLQKFNDYIKILIQNSKNLTSKIFGVFQFEDCIYDESKCTKENFDIAFSHLKNIFKEIDTLMMKMKYVYDYFIELNDCSIGLYRGEISVRVFPQGEELYGIKMLKTNLNNTYVFNWRGWEWTSGFASSPTNFVFDIKPNYKVVAAGISLTKYEVGITCGYSGGIVSEGTKRENPLYFNPKNLV